VNRGDLPTSPTVASTSGDPCATSGTSARVRRTPAEQRVVGGGEHRRAVEHDGRRLTVPEGAEPDKCGLSDGAHVRAVLVGIDDERRPELRGESGEGAACLRALLERPRVVAEQDVDLAPAGEVRQRSPLARGGPVPVATGARRPGRKRASVGETAQATETEACPGREVVQTEAERHGAGGGSAGAGERLGVVVVSVDEQKLEAGSAKQGPSGAEEAASFRVARQVAEVAEGEERVAPLLDGSLEQVAQVASVAVQVAEDEQSAHSSRAYRVRARSRAWQSSPLCSVHRHTEAHHAPGRRPGGRTTARSGTAGFWLQPRWPVQVPPSVLLSVPSGQVVLLQVALTRVAPVRTALRRLAWERLVELRLAPAR
jgi:hypothetical protein